MNLSVKYVGGKLFESFCRSHMITIDQPRSADGKDKGMDPVELLNVSIASCAAYFAMAFLRRRISDLTGLEVECDWQYAENPHRVGTIDLKVVLPACLSEQEKEGLLRSVEHCTVKNTLEHPPRIRVTTSSA